jgi:hypothetical protein
MTRRYRIWRLIAALFAALNAGGAVFALMSGEPLHAALHVVLLVFTYLGWKLAARSGRLGLPNAQPVDERLEHLQQSLDAIAIDVERIGEAQRYAAKVLAERARESPPKP